MGGTYFSSQQQSTLELHVHSSLTGNPHIQTSFRTLLCRIFRKLSCYPHDTVEHSSVMWNHYKLRMNKDCKWPQEAAIRRRLAAMHLPKQTQWPKLLDLGVVGSICGPGGMKTVPLGNLKRNRAGCLLSRLVPVELVEPEGPDPESIHQSITAL